jgi:hypothetical protein
MSDPITRNARDGAIALAAFAPLHGLVSWRGAPLTPLAFACWLGLSFGVLCLADELGAAKPLNRAGLVLFAAAFVARALMALSVNPLLTARAQLLYAFAVMGALLSWSVALLHRRAAARAVGAVGAVVAGGGLAAILAAHLLVGGVTIFGFSALFLALANPTLDASGALATVDAILGFWALFAAALMSRRCLNTAA